MTSHYLLYDSTLKSVDVVEIEPAIVQAANIGEKVSTHLPINDATSISMMPKHSFLHTTANTTSSSPDLQPLGSGVSGLFSRFSGDKNHLNKDGILVQWFHKYESDVSILVSIFKALREHFPYYVMYTAGSDLITIATTKNSDCLNIKRTFFKSIH